MRFSIAKLLIATVAVNLIVCLSFAVPFVIGFPILSAVSLFVLPPALAVAVLHTRGATQAFFIGCMMAGIAHFLISIYLVLVMFLDYSSVGDIQGQPVQYLHIIGYTIGLIGGLSGATMYWIISSGGVKKLKTNSAKTDQVSTESEPMEYRPFQPDRNVDVREQPNRVPR